MEDTSFKLRSLEFNLLPRWLLTNIVKIIVRLIPDREVVRVRIKIELLVLKILFDHYGNRVVQNNLKFGCQEICKLTFIVLSASPTTHLTPQNSKRQI